MKLENVAHFLSPKTIQLDRIATFPQYGNIKREDVITALSYVNQKSRFGIELYLAKINIGSPDKALEMLLFEAMSRKNECAIFQSMSKENLENVMRIISAFVYQDYHRSAESERPCKKCQSSGFIDVDVFTNTRHRSMKTVVNAMPIGQSGKLSSENNNIKRVERIICKTCNGKGKVRFTCQCRGRGQILDKEQSLFRQIPVFKECDRCHGRGYSRVRFSTVLQAIQSVYSVKKSIAYRQIKPFFEMLVAKCYQEEAHADIIFSRIMECS